MIRIKSMAMGALVLALSTQAASAQDNSSDESTIVVTGQLEEAEVQVETLTRAITRRPRSGKPLARRYDGICIGVFGMSENFAHVLMGRIEENARTLGIDVMDGGCQANTIIAFTPDSRKEIERLRKEEPWLFKTLLDYEYDRILRGNGAAQSWQSTKVKGANGMEFATVMMGSPPREVQINKQPVASNIAEQVRVDVEGSIVVFDSAYVPGKSIEQLADYATMRLFAPTEDTLVDGGGGVETILSLFAQNDTPPKGLTDFDRAYLNALYTLPVTAGGAALDDATWSAYRKSIPELEIEQPTDD